MLACMRTYLIHTHSLSTSPSRARANDRCQGEKSELPLPLLSRGNSKISLQPAPLKSFRTNDVSRVPRKRNEDCCIFAGGILKKVSLASGMSCTQLQNRIQVGHWNTVQNRSRTRQRRCSTSRPLLCFISLCLLCDAHSIKCTMPKNLSRCNQIRVYITKCRELNVIGKKRRKNAEIERGGNKK